MAARSTWSLVTVHVFVAALLGVLGHGAMVIAGFAAGGYVAWIGSLLGMVAGGLALTRYLASELESAGDAAAMLARGEPVALPGASRITEVARLIAEHHGAADRLESIGESARALRHEQDALMDAVDGGVLALDREQRIISINRAAERILGLTTRAARGVLLQDVTRYDALNRFVTDAIAGSQPTSDEFQLQSPIVGGGRIGLSVRASSRPLLDHQGRSVGVLVFMTDVTRLRRLEAVRTDFAANVSHELRTPITSIRGYVDTLLEGPLNDPDATRQFLLVVQRNATRLSSIVDDMLALTSLERPDTAEHLNKVPAALADVIRPVLELTERERAQRGATIMVEGDTSLRASISAGLVEQALENLVSNAIRYSPPGKPIIIRCGAAELPGGAPGVELSVTDEGPGIPPEHLPRVFERFYRVDKSRGRDQGGTGLGLSIVKHIALAHGGKVTVESTLGKGSTFRLRLPAA